ncbi:MBL fold metallo-hydrolase [Anaerocolumna sp. AGMB13020]|uniref:MBL fold metallo-hydrolase n=1 Tax=Anaerocolumna sp. AGMB13020 TaxID=3081750 RepID=UPI0029529E7B|nr:MBL fold metallo-hydrolase [Anaerocolumna sp. AGMB13020]WOO37948.1 MBL fold metallo-hydrolase [Anaerocolumna sp. AGMB13020]
MESSCKVNTIRCKWANYINYTYIISKAGTKECLIVDPAWEIKKIIAYLEINDLNVKAILLTHSHYDHTNLVGALVSAFNAEVYISGIEAKHYRYSCKNLRHVEHLELLPLAFFKVRVLLTPGHTLGSACYWISDNLFTGDTLFYEGCGLCDTSKAASDMYDSLQFLKDTVSKDTIIYPGHCYGVYPGQPFELILEDNIYFNIKDRSKFIDFRMNVAKKNLFAFK